MSERRTLLAVLAHPDDESYGTGGTLARYAAEGVDVHVAIATDGIAGSVDEKWQGERERLAEARADELDRAARVLGVTIHRLGFRDSGYIGDPANQHPKAFMNLDQLETVRPLVALIRQLRPQVVMTHDETGGYFHPDHIQCCDATTLAFHAAGESAQFPEIGPAPYLPERLYHSAFSSRWVTVLTWLMRLRGRDPRHGGRNRDIDYTRLGVDHARITTTIDYGRYWNVKVEASAQHGSQGGGTSFMRYLPTWMLKLIFAKEFYIRVYPPVPPGYKEEDFFSFLEKEGLGG